VGGDEDEEHMAAAQPSPLPQWVAPLSKRVEDLESGQTTLTRMVDEIASNITTLVSAQTEASNNVAALAKSMEAMNTDGESARGSSE